MKKLFVVILSVAIPLLLYADVVELTTGERLEGKIIGQDEMGVTLKVPYGTIIIEKAFIKFIQKDKDGPGGDKKDPPEDPPQPSDKSGNTDVEGDARQLKWRVERWMESRKKLACEKCNGAGVMI